LKGDGVTLRIPRWLAIALAGIVGAAAIGAGAWFIFARDTGPSEEERAAQEREEEAAEAEAAAAQCEQQLTGLLTALEDLDSRLGGVGVDYEEYGQRVGDVSSAYDQTPIAELEAECLNQVGIHTEEAVNSYIEAGNVWNECFDDIDCTNESIESELQGHWAEATSSIEEANQGLTDIGGP
jgi:hypothetical protein